jgi:hypothetical protein
VNVENKGQSKQWMHTHSPNKPKKFKQTLSACQKADGNCVMGQERSVEGGIHVTRDHNNVRSVLRNTKDYVGLAIQNKRRRILTYGVVLLHDHTRSHTAARNRTLLGHFNWELFDHTLYSPDLAPSDYHLFAYPKSWVGSQRFNNNEFMEGVETYMVELTDGSLL